MQLTIQDLEMKIGILIEYARTVQSFNKKALELLIRVEDAEEACRYLSFVDDVVSVLIDSADDAEDEQ